VDVEYEAVYILAPKQRLGKGNLGRVVGSKHFFHGLDLTTQPKNLKQEQNKIMSTPLNRLSDLVDDQMQLVDGLIKTRMVSGSAPRIADVAAHLISAGGKRIRPLLTLSYARMLGFDGEADAKLAAAVEFIHTATLLHDDVVDESDKRRGRPTANLLWDNKSSVLVGDFLFSRSFQLMVETGSLRVLDILANASAVIAEGEVLQLTTAQDIATSEATYLTVVRGKTAALFSAACQAGAVIAKASEADTKAAYDYGDALGISFQIADDVLDYGGATAALGKNVGDDFRERKVTLPLIYALEKADASERAFWQRTIGEGAQNDGDLDEALAILERHGALDQAREAALGWSRKAQSTLEAMPDTPIRTALSDTAEFVVSRIV